MKILIKNGRVIDPARNFDETCDVALAAGRIIGIRQVPGGLQRVSGHGVTLGYRLRVVCTCRFMSQTLPDNGPEDQGLQGVIVQMKPGHEPTRPDTDQPRTS